MYPTETTVATITADWREVTPEMMREGYPRSAAPFGSLMKWAGTWLRRRKEGKETYPFVEALPHTQRCRSCQIRPINPETLRFYPDWPLCDVCLAKRKHTPRNEWFERFREQAGADMPPCAYPQDLTELGEACRAPHSGYVGFIYLDGDNFGQVFEQVRTPEEASLLSEAIRRIAEKTVFDALARYVPPEWVKPSPNRVQEEGEPEPPRNARGDIRIHPFEIITVGGDDLLLIVPADRAIPVACFISREFQTRLRQELERSALPAEIKSHPYTLSGGVVLAADHNPVRVLRDLSRELKANAKRARHEAQATEGYLDFVVLKSADMVERTVGQMRRLYPYQVEVPGDRPLRLLGRPYPVSVLNDLWETLQDHPKRLPRTQMHQIAEALLHGRHESTLFYLYQRARAPQSYDFLDRALVAVQGGDVHNPTPWVRSTDRRYSYQTALWDIAELYDFVSNAEEQEER